MNIFFDFDGTLADPSERHYEVYQTVVHEMGGAPLSKAGYWGEKRNKTGWENILRASNLEPRHKQEFIDRFILLIEDTSYLELDELLPGVRDTLEKVSENNKCYLVSLRRNNKNLLYQLRYLGIDKYFEEIISGHSETDGSDVKAAIIRSKLSDNNLVVGDTEADILAAKSLGIPVVAMTTGIRDKSYLSMLEPNYILDSIRGLQAVIEEVNSRC